LLEELAGFLLSGNCRSFDRRRNVGNGVGS
jgi:hypothetical protein